MRWTLSGPKTAKWDELLPLVRALREAHPQWGPLRLAHELRLAVPALPATSRTVELIRRWEHSNKLPRPEAMTAVTRADKKTPGAGPGAEVVAEEGVRGRASSGAGAARRASRAAPT